MSRLQLLGGLQHIHAAHVGHPDVREQQIDTLALQHLDRRAAVLGHEHVVAVAPQHDAKHVAQRRLIVDDQDRVADWPPAGATRRRAESRAVAARLMPSSAMAESPDRCSLRPAGHADWKPHAHRRARPTGPTRRGCGHRSRSRCDARSQGRARPPSERAAERLKHVIELLGRDPASVVLRRRARARWRRVEPRRARRAAGVRPPGIARRPLVPRLHSTWRTSASSPSYQTGSPGHVDVDRVSRRGRPRCCAAAAAASSSTCRTSSRATARPLRTRVGQEQPDRLVQPLGFAEHDVHQLRPARRTAAARPGAPAIEPDIAASGFRISCAMPAAISPTAASRCCSRASRSRRLSSVMS